MAVVRVKRHCDDAPIDALLLACKRRKTEEDNLTSIFKFAATVCDQKENVSEQISKLFNSTGRTGFKTPNISNITDKLRAENKLFSQNNRFKVVSCCRASGSEGGGGAGEGEGEAALTVVDIEEATSSPPTKLTVGEESQNKYVYDIYYAADCKLDENTIQNPISWHALDDVVFEDYSKDTYDADEESDDSNDEKNWRNDYPDEDPDSIGEEDMKLACGIGGLNLSAGDCVSLSSDGGEEAMVYGGGGGDYGAYKKRMQRYLDSEATDTSDSDSDDENC